MIVVICLQTTADYCFNVQRRERLQNIADYYVNVEINIRNILQADLSFIGQAQTLYMRNLLGWLETRLAQITVNHISIAQICLLFNIL